MLPLKQLWDEGNTAGRHDGPTADDGRGVAAGLPGSGSAIFWQQTTGVFHQTTPKPWVHGSMGQEGRDIEFRALQ